MGAACKLNVSLLTVSPVSHSVSQSGVLSLFPASVPFSALIHRPLHAGLWLYPVCRQTSKSSNLCTVCCGDSYYCYRSCSFSAIDHGPKPHPCSNSLFMHRIRTRLDKIDHGAKQHPGCVRHLKTSFRHMLPWQRDL